jgi:ubiquinone/menaquinone biosynthesis C-methylase UbiE
MRDEEQIYDEVYFETDNKSKHFRGYDVAGKLSFYRILSDLLNDVFSPKQVLDVGCGKGLLVTAFIELGIPARGVDVSRYAISKAPQSTKSFLSLVNLEKSRLPFDDESFDLITILDVLEHLVSPEKTIKEMQRVLARDGNIFVYTPFPEHPHAWADPSHISIKSEAKWIQLFRRLGLDKAVDYEQEVIQASPDLWSYMFLRRKGIESSLPISTIGRILPNTLRGFIGSLWEFKDWKKYLNDAMVYKKNERL